MNLTTNGCCREATSLLDAALEYAGYGWLVFPVHATRDGRCSCHRGKRCPQPGKHPWTCKGFKAATTDPKKIKRWWLNHPNANIGVATGAASGIVVLDIDPRNGGDRSIKKLTGRLGQLPPGPVVKTGGGGWHIFIRHPGRPVKKPPGDAPGIDIKADGGYIVGVGSIHKSGDPCLWGVPPNGSPLPEMPKAWWEWLNPSCYTSGASNTYNSSNTSDSADALILGCRQQKADGVSLDDYIHRAIEETAPSSIGIRRNRLFRFLARLKKHPELSDKPVQAVRRHVQRWHKRAYPNIGTKPFADTWQDAVGAWGRIDQRPGLIEALNHAAIAESPPGIVGELGYADDPLTVSLVVLCRALQRHHGDNPFFIGYRQAAEVVGTDAMTAMRRMKMLEADGVIKLVSKGGHKEGRANEYRYLGD